MVMKMVKNRSPEQIEQEIKQEILKQQKEKKNKEMKKV